MGCISELQIGPSGGGIYKVGVTESQTKRDDLWKLEKKNKQEKSVWMASGCSASVFQSLSCSCREDAEITHPGRVVNVSFNPFCWLVPVAHGAVVIFFFFCADLFLRIIWKCLASVLLLIWTIFVCALKEKFASKSNQKFFSVSFVCVPEKPVFWLVKNVNMFEFKCLRSVGGACSSCSYWSVLERQRTIIFSVD